MSDFILLTALAFCAASDVRTHRIPNYYVGYGAVMELLCICLEQVYGTGLGAGPAGLAGMGTGACMEAGPGMGAGFICILAAAVGFAARMALVWVLGFPLFVLGMAGAGGIKMAGLIAGSLGCHGRIDTGSCSGSRKDTASGQDLSEIFIFISLYQAHGSNQESRKVLLS